MPFLVGIRRDSHSISPSPLRSRMVIAFRFFVFLGHPRPPPPVRAETPGSPPPSRQFSFNFLGKTKFRLVGFRPSPPRVGGGALWVLMETIPLQPFMVRDLSEAFLRQEEEGTCQIFEFGGSPPPLFLPPLSYPPKDLFQFCDIPGLLRAFFPIISWL